MANSAPPSPPHRGRYVIEGELGRGGMGAVYRAHDRKTGQRVALKRVTASGSRAARRQALLEREYQTLAHLRHPRIIEVYDYGVDREGPYYTMELLDGQDLEQGGRLPWQEACAVLRDIASSLAIVHSRGLVHRDVSSRNVRRTADGGAKLFDFGGLVSMGVANDVLGTPPYMSPEVLQMQALDARADLFSLGALAYFLLTARHAYPARKIADLRDAWRTRPAPPARVLPEIPPALSQLVLQLIALDRAARPQTAAEVMERLCVIADLPKEQLPEIVRGYLSTPNLVGRHDALLSIRRNMLSLARGDGALLLIEGESGSGRSRMIDACVLEAKLLGGVVLRADAADSGEDWAVARNISAQLFMVMPEAARKAARLSAHILAYVVDALRQEETVSLAEGVPDRSVMLRELRDFVLTLAQEQRITIAVDDLDRIDEPSLAWLAALAAKLKRQSLLLVGALPRDGDPAIVEPLALRLLRAQAECIALPALEYEQTEALLGSVFGQVSNLGPVATRIHRLARGSPRTTMELAQRLADRGLARYEAGAWLLPQHIEESELPATLPESLAQRLETLGRDARDLADALAVADELSIPADAYHLITSHRDRERSYRALEELIAARIMVAEAADCRFSQRGFAPVLLARMDAAHKADLHRRLAEYLGQTGADPALRAQQLMAAGMQREAIRLLLGLNLETQLPPLPLLESALEHAQIDRELPARAVHRLRHALLSKAALVMASEPFTRHLRTALDRLEQDSGLARYRALVDAPESERLQRALTEQHQAYLQTPEELRVYNIGEALRELGRLYGSTLLLAGLTFELGILTVLPDLTPLVLLAPSMQVLMQLEHATRDWLAGRTDHAVRRYEETLARLAEPDRAGLDDAQYERVQGVAVFALGLHEAALGHDRAEERAQRLERSRALRMNAWQLRAMLKLHQGDSEAAQRAARRAEILRLQDERESHYPGAGGGLQAIGCAWAGDLLGVKRTLDATARFVSKYPGWRPMQFYGEASYRFLSGDLEGALQQVELGLELAQPGRHLAWTGLSIQHLAILRALGRLDEALALAQRYLAAQREHEISSAHYQLVLEVALCYSAAGRHAEAVALVEPLIEQVQARGSRGLVLGMFYEGRARIAIDMRDAPSFEYNAQRCAREYDRGNPALASKLARLLEEARLRGIAPPSAALLELNVAPVQAEPDEDQAVVSRMLECLDTADRARCALTMLLQSVDSYFGHLYGVAEGELIPLAGLPLRQAEPELESWLAAWFAAERALASRATGDTSTRSETTEHVPSDAGAQTEDGALERGGVPSEYVDVEGRRYYAVLIVDRQGAEQKIAALFTAHTESGVRRRPPSRLLANIASQLLAHDDVHGLALGG